ncbi:NAD-dependent epimerase/dehydratase family protein [Patescibacteria group bacterium]|nr:NAD-dependent epimerase/dehydratase family protein [Patescibacteria group bacterium]
MNTKSAAELHAHRPKRILVTGSSGSIGTRACEILLENGYDVVGVDKDHNEWNPEVEKRTIITDLTDRTQVHANLPTNVDMIVHLAAHARIGDLIENPLLARDNLESTVNVWEFARRHNIKKTILASSREVYGGSTRESWTEDCIDVDGCESPYAMSKVACEAIARSYTKCYGIDCLILRFSNSYGKYDTYTRIIPLIISRVMSGKDLTVFGAEKTLDFTYVDDTVSGLLLALDRYDTAKNQAYNIAAGTGTRIVDLITLIQKHMGTDIPVHIEKNRVGDMMKFVGTIEKARRVLGYTPKVSLEQGLISTIAWYKDFYTRNPHRMPGV